MTGKVTIEVDLGDFGKDLDYPFEDLLRDEVVNYIRAHIQENIIKQHKRYMNKWTTEYLKGNIIEDPPGTVMLAIPIDLIKGK